MTLADRPPGRLLSRRKILATLSAAGSAWLAGGLFCARTAGAAGPSCVARPQQTAGPYFVDEHLQRADIRSDPASGNVLPGVPLALTLRVSRMSADGCSPLAGAQVDIWHCDVHGVYSD